MLARAQRVDLARISLSAVVEQLARALHERTAALLGEKADWLVMGAWLVLLRTRLLLPREVLEHGAAEAEAERLRGALLAAWLAGRPQLGRDVFARGRPELVGVAREVDVIEFLWAAMALFDADLPATEATPVWRSPWLDLYSVPDASERIRRLVTGTLAPVTLAQLLPRPKPDAPAQAP